MKIKKTIECLNRMCRVFGISIRKATSYNAVKGRLNYRLYSDDLLNNRENYKVEDFQ
jgi:hypothetical protein